MSQLPSAGIASLNATDGVDTNALRRSAGKDSPEALRAAARQFEALFMNMMMKSMRQAAPADGPFDSDQSRMYTAMLDQKISEGFAKRGIGLADALMRQLSNNAGVPYPDGVNSVNGVGGMPGTNGPSVNAGLSATPPSDGAASVSGAAASGRNAAAAAAYSAQSGASADDAWGTTPGLGPTDRRYPAPPAHVRAFEQKLAADAEAASRATGIPAKFMLGQAALESGWGRREIRAADGSASHNLFGIKATRAWKGRTVDAVTTEYVNGVPQKRVEKFRAYDSYADAFKDYAGMLRNNPRYRNVVANAQDVNGFAQGLQQAGYATDPHYASKLIRLIRQSLTG